jgi:ABC-type thiamin/hydroxymethylpyrimidine transport system permease subunit
MTEATMKTDQKWTTAKLALTVVLGAVNGAILTPLGLAWVAINNAFGVIGAGAFQPFIIFTAMLGWLIPQRGVFLISNTIMGFVNLLTGDPNGIATIYWGVSGGIAGEIAGQIYGWKPEKRTHIAILYGLLYIPLTNVVTAFLYGWDPAQITFWIGVVVALIAITVESTVPGVALAKWVASSGLLRTIGLDRANESS